MKRLSPLKYPASTLCLINAFAVYDHCSNKPRLRFFLADDAGAGKRSCPASIFRRCCPEGYEPDFDSPSAGLVGTWRRELLRCSISRSASSGTDARTDNPFQGGLATASSSASIRCLAPRVFAAFGNHVAPTTSSSSMRHTSSADRGNDLRIRKTDRYCLAEALAGIQSHLSAEPGAAHAGDNHWRLGWSAHHLLLLTATPHMGKDYPYYAIWRLLEPEMLATPDAFDEYPSEHRQAHFIRRTKEEMVYLMADRSTRSVCPTPRL